MDRPFIIIIAGPNRAGKTTFAREFLPNEADCPTFLNADLIAAGLSPFAPEVANVSASRLMLEQMDELVSKRQSFGFESTLSGRSYVNRVRKWRLLGYRIVIYFLRLDSVDVAIQRVAARVSQGGHDVPEIDIRRRFETGWQNFNGDYKNLATSWIVYDNSEGNPMLVSRGENN